MHILYNRLFDGGASDGTGNYYYNGDDGEGYH